MVRRGEVEAGAAGLEGDEHHRGTLLVLEGGDHPGAVAGGAVEALEGDPGALEVGLDEVEEGGPLGEDEGLVAVGGGVFEGLDEALDLGRGGGELAGDQRRVAGGLAEAEEGFEGGEDVAALGEAGDDLLAGGGADGLVDVALLVLELAVEDGLDAGGQLGGDVLLEAAEDEGADLVAQALGGAGVAVGDGAGEALVEGGAAAEEAAVGEVELAPQLVEAVLDGGAGEGDAEAGLDGVGGAGHLAVGVLDGLGLVEDDGVPAGGGQGVGVEAEDGVGGEGEVGRGVEGAAGAVVDGGAEAGAEAGDLGGPVVDDAARADHQRAAADGGEGLHGLAEAHVVGEHRAEPGVAEEAEPAHPAALVRPQLGGQVGGEGRLGDVALGLEQGGEAGVALGAGVIELVAQLDQGGERRGLHLAVVALGGEEVGDAGAVAREPVDRERSPAAVVERHQGEPVLPGAEHGGGVGAAGRGAVGLAFGLQLERDVEAIVLDVEARHQRALAEELAGGGLGAPALPRLQLLGEADGLDAVEVDPAARHQVQLVAEALGEDPLQGLVAAGHALAEHHQAAVVDAGLGRIAVDDGGGHRERVLALREVDRQAGPGGAAGLGEAPRLDLDGHALLEAGQHLAHELAQGRGREAQLAGELLQAGPGEVGLAEGVEGVAGAGDAGDHDVADARIALDHQRHAVVEVADHRAGHDHLARGPDGLAVEAHVRRGEGAEDVGDAVGGEPAGLPAAHDAVDGDVLVRGQEGAPGDPAGGGARQRDAEQLLAPVGADHHATQRERAALAGEPVAKPGDRPPRRGRRSRLGGGAGRRTLRTCRVGGLVQGDDGGGDVGARVDRGVAVARPLVVAEVERDRGGDRLAGRAHPGGEGIAAGLVAEDGALPGELDALGPGPGQAGFADGGEEGGEGRGHGPALPSRKWAALRWRSRAGVRNVPRHDDRRRGSPPRPGARPRSVRRHRLHRAPRGRGPPGEKGGPPLGAGRPEPRQARERPGRARRRRSFRGRAAPGHRRQPRPGLGRGHGPPHPGGVHHSGPLRALRRAAPRRLRRSGRPLLRPHRRDPLHPRRHRRPPRARRRHRGAHRAVLRLRLDPLGSGRAHAPRGPGEAGQAARRGALPPDARVGRLQRGHGGVDLRHGRGRPRSGGAPRARRPLRALPRARRRPRRPDRRRAATRTPAGGRAPSSWPPSTPASSAGPTPSSTSPTAAASGTTRPWTRAPAPSASSRPRASARAWAWAWPPSAPPP